MPKKAVQKKSQKNAWRRPKGGWSSNQVEKRKSKKVKLALLVLGLIVLLIIIGKIVSFINSFYQPIYADSNVSRTHVWKKDSNINLVIKTDSISLLSFNPSEKKVLIIDLPSSLYVNVPGGFGNWKLESVYDFGQAEKDKLGGNLLKKSVANLLGVPVDGYLVFSDKYKEKKVGEIINNLRDGLWNGVSMLSGLKTDLTPKELFDLNVSLKSVRFDKIENYDLTKLKILEETKLPDGTEVLISDPVRIDSFSQRLAETNVLSEKLSVAIYNATDFSGLAQKAARIITNLGGNVIVSTNATNKQQKSLVVIKKSKDESLKSSATPEVLGKIFTSDCSNKLKCDIIICEVTQERDLSQKSSNDKCKINDPQILESRAQVNVILGEDFYNRY